MPASNCSYKCNKGFHKKYHETDKCCWTCIECGKYEVSETAECIMCQGREVSDYNEYEIQYEPKG